MPHASFLLYPFYFLFASLQNEEKGKIKKNKHKDVWLAL